MHNGVIHPKNELHFVISTKKLLKSMKNAKYLMDLNSIFIIISERAFYYDISLRAPHTNTPNLTHRERERERVKD